MPNDFTKANHENPPRAWRTRVQTWLRRKNNLPCPRCAYELRNTPLYREWRVCDNCGHHFPLDARQRIKTLADPDTFHELEQFLTTRPRGITHPRGIEYAQRVRDAKRETHLREAVLMGAAKIQTRDVMLVVLDFRFLGGTMGAAAGEKIARAFEHAAEQHLPIVAVTATGGARIQEGMNALMQMAKTVSAVNLFQLTGLPYITVLTNPTTGGVYASFANLADVLLAEPRALIGFAGPRVVEILTRQELPKDSHRAEFLLEHGMVDAVVPRMELRATISKIIGNIVARSDHDPALRSEHQAVPFALSPHPSISPSPWSAVQLARHPDRPTTLDYVKRIFSDFVELHGDHFFGDDPAMVVGLAQLEGHGVVVIGLERGHGDERAQRHEGHAKPEGYRKAQRVMRLASKWNLPVMAFVDTPGADPSYEAEKRGIAMSLAYSISTMLQTRAPTIAVVIGEGGSGGALALAAADRVLMLEHAVYSVISPEGASAILYGDDAHASELANDLHLTARDALGRRIIDAIVPEPEGGAHTNADAAAEQVKAFLVRELRELSELQMEELLQARYKKYRAMGK
ncbi:MAG: acetyl-CoA carboxylase carboxyl transferase subunit beta [Chloroflexi bacterium]|nr:acetyl-CoA carboxylase carboxyl transferase subunit beta [Chloroflexota bacterium]